MLDCVSAQWSRKKAEHACCAPAVCCCCFFHMQEAHLQHCFKEGSSATHMQCAPVFSPGAIWPCKSIGPSGIDCCWTDATAVSAVVVAPGKEQANTTMTPVALIRSCCTQAWKPDGALLGCDTKQTEQGWECKPPRDQSNTYQKHPSARQSCGSC